MRRSSGKTGKESTTNKKSQNSKKTLGGFSSRSDGFIINRFRRREEVNSEPVPWCEHSYYFKDNDRAFTTDPLNLSGYYRVVQTSGMLLDSILQSCYPDAKPILALLPKAANGNLTVVLRNHIDKIGALVINHPNEIHALNIADFCSARGENSICVTSQDVTDFECDINLFDLIVLDESECQRSEMSIDAVWHALKPGGLFIYIEQTNSSNQLPFIRSKAEKENAIFEDLSEVAKNHPSVDFFENSLSISDDKGRRTQFSVIRKMEATTTDKISDFCSPKLVPIEGEATISILSDFLKNHQLHFGIFKENKIVSMTELVSHIATGAAHWNIIQPGITVLSGDLSNPIPSFDLALHPYFYDKECETISLSDDELLKLLSEEVLPVQKGGNFVLTWQEEKIGLLVVREGKMINHIPKRWKDAADEMEFDVSFLVKQKRNKAQGL